jgi:hypothetical protein
LYPNLITEWKKQLLGPASEVFDEGRSSDEETAVKEFHGSRWRIFVDRARARRRTERREMIAREHALPCSFLTGTECALF